MKKITILIVLVVNILIFTGCAPTYTLKPNYDKNTNILTINGYIIKNATETIDKQITNMNAITYEYKKFNADDNVCKKLAYKYSDISNTNRYYLTSSIEDVKSSYKNKCIIEKINNLIFFQCPINLETTSNYETSNETIYHYGITSSTIKDTGYGSKTTVYLGSKAACFVDIRDYFLNKSNSKNIQKNDVQSPDSKVNLKDLNYWYDLKVKGIITQDEFDKKKAKLLE